MDKTFIYEPITVEWDDPPEVPKRPHCPDRFTWGKETFTVAEVLSEWQDFTRRGRSQRNMRPSNLRRAAHRGSFGVGEFHFEVRVEEGDRAFEIYYDRKPKSRDDSSGQWFLAYELSAEGEQDVPPPHDSPKE